MNIAFKKTTLCLASTLSLAAAAWSPAASACGSEDFIGSICIFAGNFDIRNYASTSGQLIPISTNAALFSILGTTYGGDGRTTFALPDTRGRVIIGQGHGPGLSDYALGQKGGQEAVTLTVANLPSHSHTVSVTAYGQSAAGNADGPGGNTWAAKSRGGQYSSTAPNVAMSAGSVQATVGNTGGNQAFSIVQPYVVLRPLITLYGIYPSRS